VTGLFASEEPGMGYGAEGPLAARVSTATVEWLTGIHYRNFNLILAAAGLHVLAVLAYRLLKGQNLVRPMVTGMKELPAGVAAPRLGSPLLAATLLGVAALLVWGLSRLG
jgi:cytochrome b